MGDLNRGQVEQDTAPVSNGSVLHGELDETGQPACQPCAWFYKESGCLNGRVCRYCHLCPQGELKKRKKQKVELLRAKEREAAELAAAAESGEGSPQGVSATQPATVVSMAPGSSPQSHAPLAPAPLFSPPQVPAQAMRPPPQYAA